MRHLRTRNLLATILLPLLVTSALAQGGEEAAAAVAADTRWAVYTACSAVFVSIIVFLVLSHRRGAGLAQDISHLARRVDALEKE